MSNENFVTLTINGIAYGGFTAVSISAGVERQCRAFSVETTQKWPGNTVARTIKQGDSVEVRIGGDLVLTGFVDATPLRYDANAVTRSVSGRSKTCDVVDCSAEPQQWNNQTVLAIASALVKPYGLEVIAEADASAVITEHSVDPGESVFESIDRLLSLSRLLSTDDERGRVVIAKPGSAGRAADSLELGKNILSCSMRQDFSRCFSVYKVVGQRSGTDDLGEEEITEVSGAQTDERITRHRFLLIQQSGQVTPEIAQERATWEAVSRTARALTTEYVVAGWRQSNGSLWRPNTVVRVRDEVAGLKRDMLITEITYELSAEGLLAHITVAPPECVGEAPNAPKKNKAGKDDFEYLLPADWDK